MNTTWTGENIFRYLITWVLSTAWRSLTMATWSLATPLAFGVCPQIPQHGIFVGFGHQKVDRFHNEHNVWHTWHCGCWPQLHVLSLSCPWNPPNSIPNYAHLRVVPVSAKTHVQSTWEGQGARLSSKVILQATIEEAPLGWGRGRGCVNI